ncbi:MAG: LON peptidase substrate-binding domain-containing protein [Methylacidiphilales bacterium]|nr:LON peptidase substrate-binding domain-containing protein [Candidatus Methylacidiphilales bacterium]MDW8349639.1 LON peptidase substrate-binding domain-containing protein [Verrucomicrobiae bacterium]
MKLPGKIPVMLLADSILFPQAFLPLYIYEEHYRLLLRHALDSHRLFAIALPRRRKPIPYPIGCLGLIRACVDHPDGTSHLVLQGLCRIRFTAFHTHHPYLTANYTLHNTHPCDPHPLLDRLAKDIQETIRHITTHHSEFPSWIAPYIGSLTEHDMLCDIVAHTFIQSLSVKRKIIQEQFLPERLRLVRDALNHLAEHI